MIENLYSTVTGRYIISIILGLGISALFRKVCNERECLIIKGPPTNDIVGNIYEFERLSPKDSVISSKNNLEQLYNQIRMLDCDGYPNAFIRYGNFMFKFNDAHLKKGKLYCKVLIEDDSEK